MAGLSIDLRGWKGHKIHKDIKTKPRYFKIFLCKDLVVIENLRALKITARTRKFNSF